MSKSDDRSMGLTKREWFAGMALQGYLANSQIGHPEANDMEETAIACRMYADALLAELDDPTTTVETKAPGEGG